MSSKIPVTDAETFKSFLPIVSDWDRKKNISYHLQYIEFLYKAKQIHEPEHTTLSLLNKTIIIEYFTVIEAILDALVCQLRVQVSDGESVPIEIDEYTPAGRLLEFAKKYRVIDSDTHSQLGQIKDTRNRIHIKRSRAKQRLEYLEYDDELLNEREKVFERFITFLLGKYEVANARHYPWPWKIKA